MSITDRIDAWVNSAFKVDAESLGIARILFAVFALMSGATYQWLAGLPNTFFLPPFSPAILFTGFPSPAVVYAFDFAAIALLILIGFGLFTRTASVALTCVWIVANSFEFSLGKIDHTILGVLVPLVGGFAGWGNRFSVDSLRAASPRPVQVWPLSIFAVAIAFTMLTAALPKIETGWLSPEGQSVRGYMLHYFHALDREFPLAAWMLGIESRWFWEAQDWFTIAFEGGFIFFAWSLKAFRRFCLVALVFHLGVFLTMGIFFADNFLAYGLFVPWRELVPARAIAPSRMRWKPLAGVAIASAVVGAAVLIQVEKPVPDGVKPWLMTLLAVFVVVFFSGKALRSKAEPAEVTRGRTSPRPVS